jgi:hypothetical protein
MTFKQSIGFTILFGQYKGQTIGQISRSDKGLAWLDWLRGQREEQRQAAEKLGKPFNPYPSDEAVAAFLDDPTTQKELRESSNA